MSQRFIGVTLPIRLGQTGMFEQSTSVLIQTRSNFKNLILTKKGERLAQPELGCDLWTVLFEPANENVITSARLAVESAIERWMPYIELVSFDVISNENTIDIKSSYRFKDNPNIVDEVRITTSALGTVQNKFMVTTRSGNRRRGLADETEPTDIANPSATIPGNAGVLRRRITFR